MKLNKKYILGASVALAIVGLWLIFKGNKSKASTSSPSPSPNPNPSPTPTPSKNDNFPLKRGSFGARVKELQLVLLKYDANILPKYGVDGDFGSETENALVKISGKNSVDSQSELDALKYSKSSMYP